MPVHCQRHFSVGSTHTTVQRLLEAYAAHRRDRERPGRLEEMRRRTPAQGHHTRGVPQQRCQVGYGMGGDHDVAGAEVSHVAGIAEVAEPSRPHAGGRRSARG